MIQTPNQLLDSEREALSNTSELVSEGCVCIARRAAKPPAVLPETKVRVLLLDDDRGFADVMEKMLGFAGYSVRTATDRESGSRELRAVPQPHLILLDVELGEVDGFDVLARLRRHPRLGAVPVIMLTGRTSRQDVARGLLRGADGYVSKPCRLFALNHAIRTVLGMA